MTNVWLGLSTCAGHLALALLVMMKRTRSPLALPLTLLCVNLFAWSFAALAYGASGNPAWHWLDVSVSPFCPALGLHVVIAFVGRRRPLRSFLLGAYLFFGLFALSSATAFFTAWGRSWVESRAWAFSFLAALGMALLPAIALLIAHLRRTLDPAERTRTRVVLAALMVGIAGGASELANNLYPSIPGIGNLATLLTTTLVAMVALRFRLLDGDLPAAMAVYAAVLAVVFVGAYLEIFQWLTQTAAILILGVATALLALVATTRELSHQAATQRERTERLATMGKLSEQMAHDLKNPLAALKGALQFLTEEERQGKTAADQGEFLTLMLEQVDKLHRVVEDYQRVGRVEAMRAPLDVNEIVEHTLSLQPFATQKAIGVRTDLAPLPPCLADRDLLATALENLVRNAFEAMPEGGTVTVRTESAAGDREGITIVVEDSGIGMDARQVEHAFDEAYSTKPSGTGLGLTFVRRVAKAHGGDVSLSSELGRGTRVRLRLPLDGRA